MQPPDHLVPLALLVVGVVRLIIDHQTGRSPARNPFVKILNLDLLRRLPRTENRRHDVRLILVPVQAGALVELLDVGEVEGSFGAGSLALASQVDIEVPEDLEVARDHGVRAENPAAGEVGAQALEDDDVGGHHEEGPGVVGPALDDGVEVLPGDGQGHDLRLATTGGHLDRVAREVVVLQQL